MQRRAIDGRDYLHCLKRGCCMGARYDAVEARVMASLKDTLRHLEVDPACTDAQEEEAAKEQLRVIREALTAENRKKARLYEFLEDGTYSKEEFRVRMDTLKARIASLERQEAEGMSGLDHLACMSRERRAQNVKNVLELYWDTDMSKLLPL